MFVRIVKLRRPIAACILALAVAGGISGCASVSIHQKEKLGHSPGHRLPDKIFVQDFLAPPQVFRVDRDGEDLNEVRADLVNKLARNTVWRIRDRITDAERVPLEAVLPSGNYWLVTGRFLRVNQGSRFLRMGIGFGAGGSKLETEVLVYDLSSESARPFLKFRTTGGSNAHPGAIANLSFVGAAISGATLALTGLTFDTVRTSREIVSSLSYHLGEHGGIDPEDAQKPKMLGQWP